MEPTGLGHDKVHFVRDHFDGRLRVVQINRLNILPSLNFLNLFFLQKENFCYVVKIWVEI